MTAFEGFPKELLRFFAQLKINNNKAWFDAHRPDYEAFVLEPAKQFVVALGERLQGIAPTVRAIPKVNQSLFRINRDIRFSADKRPYKTHLGLWFCEGTRKRMECSGFYFHVEDKKLMLGTGMHVFPRRYLPIYREAVVDKKSGPDLIKAIEQVSKKGYPVGGKHYKRLPREYGSDHPRADLLLFNGLFASIEMPVADALGNPKIVDMAFNHYRGMLPLHAWLKAYVSDPAG